MCEAKRPDRLLDLAEACPDMSFEMVGPVYDTAYSQEIYKRAMRMENVILRGPLSHGQTLACYRRAVCLCCTSVYEGFPNTFLEAWSQGLPVVSTFDPGGLIVKHGLGKIAHDVEGLACSIRELLRIREQYHEIANSARQYYRSNHTVGAVMPRFEKVFTNALGAM